MMVLLIALPVVLLNNDGLVDSAPMVLLTNDSLVDYAPSGTP